MANNYPTPVCLHEAPPPIPEQQNLWQRHHLFDNARKAASLAIRSTLAIGAGLAVGSLLGDTTVRTDHLEAKIQTEITADMSGGTRINTPILDVDYPTHMGPFGLEVTAEDISIDQLITNIAEKDPKQQKSITESLQQDSLEISQAAKEHTIKYLLLTGSMTAASFLALSRKGRLVTKQKLVGSLLVGGLVIAAPTTVGYATWDPEAFSKRVYSGDLAIALNNPDIVNNLDKYDASLSVQAQYIVRLVQAIENINNRTEENIAVRQLALGDLHQRNVFPIVQALIKNYSIDFITDAGDIVDWGQSVENGFFQGTPTSLLRDNTTGIADLKIPYYFARGNHDFEQTTVKALSKIPNVQILETGKYFHQNGLIITGSKDPVFTPNLRIGNDSNNQAEIESGQRLQAELNRQPADIAILHNPVAGEQVTAGTQVQISGHTHRFKYTEPVPNRSPARLNTGTSGGAGLRTFDTQEGNETEQTFTILNYASDCRLVSLDKITISSLDGSPEFNIQHIPVDGSVDPSIYQDRNCQ